MLKNVADYTLNRSVSISAMSIEFSSISQAEWK